MHKSYILTKTSRTIKLIYLFLTKIICRNGLAMNGKRGDRVVQPNSKVKESSFLQCREVPTRTTFFALKCSELVSYLNPEQRRIKNGFH